MTEVTTNEVPNTSESAVTAAVSGDPKLWAGKYKTVEELENAYKNSSKIYNENKELQQQLELAIKIPDDYTVPKGLSMREHEINEIKSIAKNSGLTQQHFEKMATEMQSKIQANIESFDQQRKSIGDEKLKILQDYVKKTYPEKLQQVVLNHIIKDGDVMTDALHHRDQLLNSKVPGMDKANQSGGGARYDGEKELQERAREYQKSPTETNRRRYTEMAEEVGRERFKDKM